MVNLLDSFDFGLNPNLKKCEDFTSLEFDFFVLYRLIRLVVSLTVMNVIVV